MDWLAIGKECYLFNDVMYDQIFQSILMDSEYEQVTKDNISYFTTIFMDNVENILDTEFGIYSEDESQDYSNIFKGFEDYLKFITNLI